MKLKSWGLELRLFALVFTVATLVSGIFAFYTYQQEKRTVERQLADQLIRVAHVFAASLDPSDVERLPHEPADSALVATYRDLAQGIADEAGLAYAYTCAATKPGTCVWGVVTNDLVAGETYDYGDLPAAEAWGSALAGVPSVSPIYTDEYGEWKNGVVPVYNAAGDVVALAGVDLDASFVRAELAAQLRTALVIGGILIAIWLVIARVIASALIRPVTGALARFSVLVGRVAEGDLSIEELAVRGDDEVGRLSRAFNAMVASVRQLVHGVVISANTVASSAEELTAASRQVAQVAEGVALAVGQVADGASNQSEAAQEATQIMAELRAAIEGIAAGAHNQAANVQETATLVGQTVAALEEVTGRAGKAADSSQKAMVTARNGSDVVEQTVAGMARIRQSVLETAQEVRDLGDLGQRIGEITDVITEIADQTNLLALNAAIEAARAGEHGRGFAVVAEEVRRLAERSAASAGEITSLIGSIQAGTQKAVRAMEQGTADVEAGSQLAANAGQALHDILHVVGETTGDVETITRAAQAIVADSQRMAAAVDGVAAVTEENTASSEQMAAGSERVSQSVDEIASVSAENAAAAEEVSASVEEMNASAGEMAAAAQSLAQIAHELQQQIARFKV